MSKRLEKDFKDITSLMAGAGGAVPFITLQAMLRDLEKQADDGNEKAELLIHGMALFAGTCRAAANHCGVEL